MEVILLLIRLILAAIFALAGVGKLLDPAGSEKAVKDFGVPELLAKPLAILLPIGEIVTAIALLLVQTSWFGANGAALLLSIFIVGMVVQMMKGNAPDCHCFGALHSEPVSPKSLLRNAVFAALALALMFSGRENQGRDLFAASNDFAGENVMQLILGLAVVALLAAAVYFLKRISEQQTQIMRRIEILELTTADGGKAVEKEDVSHPEAGLPVGAPAPDFALPDLNGRQVAFEHLLMKGKPLLFFFVSHNCNPCAALLPEIEAWQNELQDKLEFVFISKGKAQENAAKFGGAAGKQILLQKDNETADLFGAQWTPSAVLINADGMIASKLAAGDAAIRELVEKLRDAGEISFISTAKGMKIGEDVPAFALADTSGKTVKSEDLRGKKTLLTYWSLGCGFCTQMLDELRDWEKTRGADEPNLLLVSSGEAEANRQLNLTSPVILDNQNSISKKIGMTGTPSAILVDENGRIVSEVAVGAPQIWALISKRK